MISLDNHTLDLDKIRIDGGTQPREFINEETVAEYADAMADGAYFPPVVVFFDGAANWLADGFHRYHASKSLGLADIAADVREGTWRDAVLFSVGANATHGLPRSNKDKRRAVLILLADDKWTGKPNTWVAEAAVVSREFVRKVRQEIISQHATLRVETDDQELDPGELTDPIKATHVLSRTISTLRAVASSVESINIAAVIGNEGSTESLAEIKQSILRIRRNVTRLLGACNV